MGQEQLKIPNHLSLARNECIYLSPDPPKTLSPPDAACLASMQCEPAVPGRGSLGCGTGRGESPE